MTAHVVGARIDTETGFQYLRARYYDPTTGQFLTRDPIEAVSRDPYGYAYNSPLNYVDPTGLIGFPHLPSASDFVEGFVDTVGDGLGEVASYVGEHKVGILKGGALLLAVAAVPATGGTSLALGAGALGLSTTAELLDDRPCKSRRVVQSLALGGAGLTVGALWVGAGQSAAMAGHVASIDVAGRIGSGFSAGSVLTNFVPSPECGC